MSYSYFITVTPFSATYITQKFHCLYCSNDIIAMVLAKPNAIQEWRDIIGPTNPSRAREESPESLRARYGNLQDQTKNAVHGSDHYHTAEKEIRFMFPHTVTEPVYTGQLAKDYLQQYVSPVLARGLTQLCIQKPVDPLV